MPYKTGILLSNLGTPAAPSFGAVRSYLKEFLSDPRVIDLPRWKWLPILNGIILNIRPFRSAKNYQKIWTPQGSPLLLNSLAIRDQLRAALPNVAVSLGMRYGKPSLKSALLELRQAEIERLVILPLYPQYSATTTATTLDRVIELMKLCSAVPEIHMVNDYHQHPLYIKALQESVLAYWQSHGKPDKLILSYHSLPKRYVERGDPYYRQCLETSRLLCEALAIDNQFALTTFQSRVGFEEWLQPYTLDTISNLPKQGVKKIQVICPGFACDCLETLEEIAMQNREAFLEKGGEHYDYIPALNDSKGVIDLLLNLIDHAC